MATTHPPIYISEAPVNRSSSSDIIFISDYLGYGT